MAAFPFGLYRAALGRMKRMITAPAHTFSLLAPVQADWRGTQTEAMLFLTRRGQVCALNFFNSDTNYNFAIAAPSGFGKSFLVNKVLQEHASHKGVCYVVDVGRSYKKQCELQMGQYIEFEEGRNMSVNVFSELTAELFALDEFEVNESENNTDKDRVRKREERATLLTLYTQLLAVMASSRETITDLEFAILSNTIVEAYKRLRPGGVMEIDCFMNVLLTQQAANDAMGKQEHIYGQLAERLKKYCRDGEYGRWFRGPMNISFERPFVVLELEQLNTMKDLREVILLLLISIVERQFYLGNRKIPKIMLCDEAWDLFRNPNTAAFIETAYLRMRKYNGSIGTVVQSFLDFANRGNAEVSQAILSNSEWKLALQPKTEELKECVQKNLLALSDAELRIAGTVRTTKGSYSEVLLLSSNQSSVFRFIPTPAEKTAFTTTAAEVAVYERIREALCRGLRPGESPAPLTVLGFHATPTRSWPKGPRQTKRNGTRCCIKTRR